MNRASFRIIVVAWLAACTRPSPNGEPLPQPTRVEEVPTASVAFEGAGGSRDLSGAVADVRPGRNTLRGQTVRAHPSSLAQSA